jgi:hypothetical protein
VSNMQKFEQATNFVVAIATQMMIVGVILTF